MKARFATKAEVKAAATKTIAKHGRSFAKLSDNPWIAKVHFDTLMDRCVQAENMCKDLIRIIALDDGEFLAQHSGDYLAAGEAIKKGDI